jgi:hypothetical protein
MNTFAGTIEKPILVKKGEPIPQHTGGRVEAKTEPNKNSKDRLGRLDLCFARPVRGLSWAVHFVFAKILLVGSERQSGQILVKSAARIVGTLVGAQRRNNRAK